MRRANGYGCSLAVQDVMPKPRCSVTAAMALTSIIGSLIGTFAAVRTAASALPPYTSHGPSASAMNSESNRPRSSSRAISVQWRRSLYSRE